MLPSMKVMGSMSGFFDLVACARCVYVCACVKQSAVYTTKSYQFQPLFSPLDRQTDPPAVPARKVADGECCWLVFVSTFPHSMGHTLEDPH